jgi:hypothetical protein
MSLEDKNYEYLLRLYSLVDVYLAKNQDENEFPEIVVAFCTVTEKILKIRLSEENPFLVFDSSKLKEADAMVAIIKEKELNIETIRIGELLRRYALMFENEFSDDELQVLVDIYNVRNHFSHNHKSDEKILLDEENLVKKMGTVWEKISKQAKSLFSKTAIKTSKPKKRYSEEELEKVLTEEVRTKIKSADNLYGGFVLSGTRYSTVAGFSLNEEECPRCGRYTFSVGNENPFVVSHIRSVFNSDGNPDLYKCKNCDLELTKKEYEIAKKIKGR